MRSNLFNILMFVVAVIGLYFLLQHAEKNWFPPPPPREDKSAEDEAKRKAEEDEKRTAARRQEADRLRERIAQLAWPAARPLGAIAGSLSFAAEVTRPEEESRLIEIARSEARWESTRAAASVAGVAAVELEPKKPPRRRVSPTLIAFGDDSFYNRVLLTTEGGGVQQVILTAFTEEDRLGQEMTGVKLHLIPGVKRVRDKYLEQNFPVPEIKPGKVDDPSDLAAPCFTIFHYRSPDDKFPDDHLGTVEWEIPADYRGADGAPRPKVLESGEQEMAFETELGAPYFVKFRKTFRLGPKDYHISFTLEIERLADAKSDAKLRYQLSGPRGLPIGGEWYSTTHRVALIGWTDYKGQSRRQYERGADVSVMRGGDAVTRGKDMTFKYMAIATQYFASAVAIDDERDDDSTPHPWAYVRATTEMPMGEAVSPRHVPYFDDVTVRAVSETIDLAANPAVRHKYVIYNGPAKARLLGLMEGEQAVDDSLVKRYQDALGLKTITDFHSPTWLGSFANTIYWTDVVVGCTNLMHGFLAWIHGVMPWWLPTWAISIVMLTVVVRLFLFIPSRKMTQTNMRMMEVQKKLAPQFEELKKKFEGDTHGYNRAKMQLMMANGVNPFAALGGCVLLLLQMPIMMGLYFCLQESVFFRLQPFLWFDNLAAPDMTLWWSENIPFISDPDSIGGMLYLGPYLNIMPILAIGLMFWQQLKMLPPATDDQSRQQRFMMKMMMVLMPIFFYKFASGLALYFIISTLWGLAERKLIPKPVPSVAGGPGSGGAGSSGGGPGDPGKGPEPDKPKGFFGRMKEAVREKVEEMKRQADEQSKRQIRNEPREQDQGQGGGNREQRRRDKKKKRRK